MSVQYSEDLLKTLLSSVDLAMYWKWNLYLLKFIESFGSQIQAQTLPAEGGFVTSLQIASSSGRTERTAVTDPV